MDTVGVIGVGRMGLPIAGRLLAKGYPVLACDRHPPHLAAAVGLGAAACRTPAELAARSDVILILVGFDADVLDVAVSEDGVLEGCRSGSVIAVASTVLPETMARLADAIATDGANVSLLDTPLCRGERAAKAGTLLLLAGGDAGAFERCRPVFETFASDLFRLGGLGAGQAGKMVNNLLLWACTSANHEGLKLGAALGVDPEVLRQALLRSSGSNWSLETWLEPRPMPWAERDMSLVMQEADRCRLSLPLCGVTREVIKAIRNERGLDAPGVRP